MIEGQKVLIANRGEIAVRVIRACKELEIPTVAVFSDADASAAHVRLADQAIAIGGSAASDSYLVAAKIVAAAVATGATLVHPGYGFLSENRGLAAALEAAGIKLIGPPVAAMATMGDKIAARDAAAAVGVPVVPGLAAPTGADLSKMQEVGKAALAKIGLPLLVKAAFGGGGKGMRIVRAASELPSAISEASREARSAFGDGLLYFERFLDRPRHIEIQVFADTHGNATHLGERDCSIQRRHQKLIEETPSPAVDAKLRTRMGQAAVELTKSVGYVGAGTVEFLLAASGEYYFIEMNTRLQVEHTITEMVTGVDLVKEQIRVALGAPLSCVGASARGHAIECRISAEDPLLGFAPSTGKVLAHRPPHAPHVRVDDGLGDDGEISLYYDPMFAKLIVWGRDRAEAIERMRAALCDYLVAGVHTTIPFHQTVLEHPEFVAGRADITFVDRIWDAESARLRPAHQARARIALALAAALECEARDHIAPPARPTNDAWKRAARLAALRGHTR